MGLDAGATTFVPRAQRIGFAPGGGGSAASSPNAQAQAPPAGAAQGATNPKDAPARPTWASIARRPSGLSEMRAREAKQQQQAAVGAAAPATAQVQAQGSEVDATTEAAAQQQQQQQQMARSAQHAGRFRPPEALPHPDCDGLSPPAAAASILPGGGEGHHAGHHAGADELHFEEGFVIGGEGSSQGGSLGGICTPPLPSSSPLRCPRSPLLSDIMARDRAELPAEQPAESPPEAAASNGDAVAGGEPSTPEQRTSSAAEGTQQQEGADERQGVQANGEQSAEQQQQQQQGEDDSGNSAKMVLLAEPPTPGGTESAPSPVMASTMHRTPSASDLLRKVGAEDFEVLCVVGQGAFGRVFQVYRAMTEEILAMKVMRKDRILGKNHSEYVRTEKNILTRVKHPYVVELRYSFQTPQKLYLLLEFVNGGHLYYQLVRQGIFREEVARLYAAELLLALEHLHSLGIAHRDLKPENILLDVDGHIKLTDFGLARPGLGDSTRETNSMVGTVEYMAPEVLTGKGHGKPADWWSLGIIITEMLTGEVPFKARSKAHLQKTILSQKLRLPGFLSQHAHSLLKALLNKDAAKRLGSAEGAAELRRHPFFKPINWKALEERRVPSPFRPAIQNGQRCTSNFDEEYTSMPARDSPACSPLAEGLFPEGEADPFQGFSYTCPSVLTRCASSGRLALDSDLADDAADGEDGA